jgi:hypothetical protein
MRRFALLAAIAVLLSATAAGAGARFPERIDLPNGFFPEGIDIARGGMFYVGSIPTGAVYRGDVRTGEGAVLVPGVEGRMAIGVDIDRRGASSSRADQRARRSSTMPTPALSSPPTSSHRPHHRRS